VIRDPRRGRMHAQIFFLPFGHPGILSSYAPKNFRHAPRIEAYFATSYSVQVWYSNYDGLLSRIQGKSHDPLPGGGI
jgi:hypothetical protein